MKVIKIFALFLVVFLLQGCGLHMTGFLQEAYSVKKKTVGHEYFDFDMSNAHKETAHVVITFGDGYEAKNIDDISDEELIQKAKESNGCAIAYFPVDITFKDFEDKVVLKLRVLKDFTHESKKVKGGDNFSYFTTQKNCYDEFNQYSKRGLFSRGLLSDTMYLTNEETFIISKKYDIALRVVEKTTSSLAYGSNFALQGIYSYKYNNEDFKNISVECYSSLCEEKSKFYREVSEFIRLLLGSQMKHFTELADPTAVFFFTVALTKQQEGDVIDKIYYSTQFYKANEQESKDCNYTYYTDKTGVSAGTAILLKTREQCKEFFKKFREGYKTWIKEVNK